MFDVCTPSSSMDAPSVSNEVDGMSHDGVGTAYLGVGTKHDIYEVDGFGSLADTTNGHRDAQSVETDADMTANVQKIVRMPRKRSKLPDLPFGTTRQCPYKSNGCGNRNGLSVRYAWTCKA